MSMSTTIVCVLLLLWALKKFKDLRARVSLRGPYPPGPIPKPLIGNAFDFPISFPALRYAEWGGIYKSESSLSHKKPENLKTVSVGHILHVEAFGNHIVVLNKREDAEELFEKRAKIYSDRPEIPIMKL